MARRHEDRKPGQRFTRGTKGPAKKGPAKKGPTKKGPAKKASVRKAPTGKAPTGKAPARKVAGSKVTGNERSGNERSGKKVAAKKSVAKRMPLRGSKRRAEGLVVKPSSVFGDSKTSVKDGKVRLNHFLAKAGLCSRRNADELIASGRIEVNGERVRELGIRVDPLEDDVRYDGTQLQPEKAVYVLLNKPKGVVCTNARHEQKKRVVDLLPTIRGRVFTVGRLDMDSEGLLMITNDGAFAQEMTHPRYGVGKLYSVIVRGRIEDQNLGKARGGVWLSEGPTGGMDIKVERLAKERTFLKVTLREGKNREIRRVFAKLGHPVIALKRVRIGNLSLHGLRDGDWRFLQLDEVAKLRDLARDELREGGEAAAADRGRSSPPPSAARKKARRPTGRR